MRFRWEVRYCILHVIFIVMMTNRGGQKGGRGRANRGRSEYTEASVVMLWIIAKNLCFLLINKKIGRLCLRLGQNDASPCGTGSATLPSVLSTGTGTWYSKFSSNFVGQCFKDKLHFDESLMLTMHLLNVLLLLAFWKVNNVMYSIFTLDAFVSPLTN
jgi:hypothetical protein